MPLPAPVELVLDPDAEIDTVIRHLGRVMAVHADTSRSGERVLLDTFDGRLSRRGWTAWRQARPGADGLVPLTVEREGELPLNTMAAPLRRDRVLVEELVAPSARSRLGPVLEERALLALLRLHTTVQSLNVCNKDAKTVVRMFVEDHRLLVRDGEVALATRVRVVPVLGYDKAFARVAKVLQGAARLAPAGMSLVEEATLAAGLPPGGVSGSVEVSLRPAMPAGEAMMKICRRLAEIVEVNLPGTLDDLDPEFLHDLRVAVRRTRSVLKEMKGVLDPDVEQRARADLRWIQEVTGPTRDLDVLLHDWPAMVAPVPQSMAGDLQPLYDLLTRHRGEALVRMCRDLRGRRFKMAWENWRSELDGPDATGGPNAAVPVGELAGGRIVAVYRTMVKMGSAIQDDSPPQMLHDLRKRGKELRYLLELFGGMWAPGKVKPLVGALKGLQDVLGYFQDDEIQVAELRGLGPELAATPGGTDSLIALGFVLDELSSRQRQARESFEARFADFSRPATRRLIDDTFGPEAGGRRRAGRRL